MKKIIFAVMAVVAAIGLMGGAFAYFSDTETSTGNEFTAGTLDLQLSTDGDGTNGVYLDAPFSGPVVLTDETKNMAPGVAVGPYPVYFKNAGSIDGKVRVTFGYTKIGTETDEDATNYAKNLIVTEAMLVGDSDNKAPGWVSTIADTYTGGLSEAYTDGAIISYNSLTLPTIYGLSRVTLKFYYPGVSPLTEVQWTPDFEACESWKLELNKDVGNEYQELGVEVTLTATILQYSDPN